MKFWKWIRYDAVCWFDCSSIVAIFRWNSLNYHFCQFQAYLPLPSDFKFTDYLGAWWLELNFWIFKLTDLVVLLIKRFFPNTVSGWKPVYWTWNQFESGLEDSTNCNKSDGQAKNWRLIQIILNGGGVSTYIISSKYDWFLTNLASLQS